MLTEGQRKLTLAIAAIFVFAVGGAALFHIRASRGAHSFELMGWAVLLAAGCLSAASVVLNRYGPKDRSDWKRAFLGIAAGSGVLTILPFALVHNSIYYVRPGMYRMMMAVSFAVTALVLMSIALGIVYEVTDGFDEGLGGASEPE